MNKKESLIIHWLTFVLGLAVIVVMIAMVSTVLANAEMVNEMLSK